MPTVTIEDAQAKLPQLIEELGLGEEIIITRNSQPVAKLVSQPPPQPIFGRGKGKVLIVAEDEEHLKDFEDYMP